MYPTVATLCGRLELSSRHEFFTAPEIGGSFWLCLGSSGDECSDVLSFTAGDVAVARFLHDGEKFIGWHAKFPAGSLCFFSCRWILCGVGRIDIGSIEFRTQGFRYVRKILDYRDFSRSCEHRKCPESAENSAIWFKQCPGCTEDRTDFLLVF